MYKLLARPVLFSIDEERSHAIAEQALRIPVVWKSLGINSKIGDARIQTNIAGLALPSPIGLAAGFDKNCKNLPALLDFGFGFVTGGTVTLSARPGNPKPRMLRATAENALINSLGFPGEGVMSIAPRVRRIRNRADRILISISGAIEDEIVACYRRFNRHVAGIELNISSPNTAGLRVFHDPARLRNLVEQICSQPHPIPIFVKLPPWTADSEDRRRFLSLIETAVNSGASGVVVANTVLIEHKGLAVGQGGLSGAPLLENTVRMTAEVSALVGKDAAVIACGGVSSAEHVWRLLAAGASAVQLYTALVYEGPGLPSRINRGLLKMMDRAGIRELSDISGMPLI